MTTSVRGIAIWCGVIAVVVILLVSAAILFPVFTTGHNPNPTRRHIKLLGLAMLMYAEDHDNRLPLSANWMDSTFAYNKNEDTLHDPSLDDKNAYGFAFFAPLSAIDLESVKNQDSVPMIYQSTQMQKNASGDLSDTRFSDDPQGGVYLVFTSGHAPFMRREHFLKLVEESRDLLK